MKILSIETSCDETAMALVEAKGGLKKPYFKISKNLVASQIKIHQPFGGIVPNLAKREHEKNLPILLNKILPSFRNCLEEAPAGIKSSVSAKRSFDAEGRRRAFAAGANEPPVPKGDCGSPDLIAITVGPGLEPCLWAGIEFAKNLAKKSEKPLIGVNHLKGHLYSFLLTQKTKIPKNIFPAVALIVSGGHTILLLMKDLINSKKLGETRDDAAGEAFDKVARLLNLPYPGGPELEKIAKKGNPASINFPRPMLSQKNYDFSFSGLKTAVLYYSRDNLKPETFSQSEARGASPVRNRISNGASGHGFPTAVGKSERRKPVKILAGDLSGSLEKKFLADIAASFQQAVIDVLTAKTFRAAKEFKAKSIWLSGGVANNKALRQNFRKESKKNKIGFFAPSLEFTTDNAAMTAVAAYFNYLKNKKSRLIAQADLNL